MRRPAARALRAVSATQAERRGGRFKQPAWDGGEEGLGLSKAGGGGGEELSVGTRGDSSGASGHTRL